MRNCLTPPADWGKDKLSEFMASSYENSYKTFLKFQSLYSRLSRVNDLFEEAGTFLNNSEKSFAGLFLFKSRAAYLGAARLAVSIQLAEVYPLLRSCLENALYGVAVAHDLKNFEILLKRHDDVDSRRKVVSKFSPKNLWPLLEAQDAALTGKAKALYEEAIDYGGHPNERSLTTNLRLIELDSSGERVRYDVFYCNDNENAIKFALIETAEVGLVALKVFQVIFKTRFELADFSEKLNRV